MGLCKQLDFLKLLPSSGWYFVWTWNNTNGQLIETKNSVTKKSECFIELLNLLTIILIFFLTLCFIVKYKLVNKKKYTSNLLPLHNLRTILCIILLLIISTELFESLIVTSPFVQIVTVLSVITCWILHRETEIRNGHGLAVTSCAFIAITILRLFRVLIMVQNDDEINFSLVRIMTTIGTCFVCGLLGIIDAFTLYRIMQRNKRYEMKKNSGYTRVSYKHECSTLLSKLTFHWVVKLLYRGYRTPLDLNDLGILPDEESTVVQFQKFHKIYEDKRNQNKNTDEKVSLWFCYWKRVWPSFLIGGILKLFGDLTTLIGPMTISKIVNYVTFIQKNSTSNEFNKFNDYLTINQLMDNGYFLGFIVFIAAILQSTFSQASTHYLNVEGIRLRTALQASIYNKSMKLYSSSIIQDDDKTEKEKNQTSSSNITDIGTLTNLMAEDVYNVMSFFWIGHYTWAIPLKISVIIYLLYIKLGISAIIGAIFCVIIVTPMQLYLGKKMSENLKFIAEKSDSRLKLLNEILQGIKFVKLRGLEMIFNNRIQKIRNKELELLDKDSIYWGLITFLTHASTILMTILTFGVYFWVEETHLDAGNVFSSLALFSQLTVPLFIFPVIIPIILNARISTKRLEDFLALPEIVNVLPDEQDPREKNEDKISDDNSPSTPPEESAKETEKLLIPNSEKKIKNSEINKKPEESPVLSITGKFKITSDNINSLTINNLSIPRGKLTLIVGKTGSGKTSLISSMLGELQLINGSINWNKKIKISYVPQRSWLQNATLKDNIIFGNNYNEIIYKNILNACGLDVDIDLLPGNDLTRIGEKGINLSGGQKQRVSIARAIYCDSDVILFDDPFSALDQHVSQQIFQLGIQKLLLEKNRTVVMATHRLEFINHADKIIAMENCRIREAGVLSMIEKNDPGLVEEWNESVKKQSKVKQYQKTAKERWSLIRLVSRIAGMTVKYKNTNNESWTTDHDAHVLPPIFIPLKLRKLILFQSRYLAHDLTDLPVPSEDWIMIKKKSNDHRKAQRAISLQPRKQRRPPILRQASTPIILGISYMNSQKIYNDNDSKIISASTTTRDVSSCEFPKINKNDDNLTDNDPKMSKKFMSMKLKNSQEWEHYPIQRLLSTESNKTDELDDVDEMNEDEIENIDEINSHDDDYYDDKIVNFDTWIKYLKASGSIPCFLFLIVAFICQFIRVVTDIWLSKWTNLGRIIDDSTISIHSQTIFYFKLYMTLSIISLIMSAINSATGQWAGACARKNIHEKSIKSLLYSSIIYFELTPIGKILNIFSSDVGIIDKKLSISFQRLTLFGLLCCSSIIINIIVSPWFITAAVPICFIYYWLQKFYRKTARQLQSLEGSTRGPVAAHFSETLSGLSVIRASSQQNRFMNDMIELLDSNTNAFLILNTSSRWLGIALDYLGAITVLTSIITSILSAKIYPERVTPAFVGLAINYTFLVPIYLNWVVKFVAEIEMYMGSVSRLAASTNNDQEDYHKNGYQPVESWPDKGDIIFDNVTLKYHSAISPIIRNLNLKIPAGQKLGICGRTGSGKSSTVMALFQLLEISEGRIIIDNIDTKCISLLSLRSRLSVIPQDIIMFSGTIRENLDPMSEYNDSDIWHALEIAQIKDLILINPDGLNYEVREGGENFSTGQLQLLSIARAVLKKSNVIIIDEATSALDSATEKKILTAIANAFKYSTVITIAHRVASLLACDKIVVFDDGKIVEEGTPTELADNNASLFSAMLRASEMPN